MRAGRPRRRPGPQPTPPGGAAMSLLPTIAALRPEKSTNVRAKSGYSALKRLFGVLAPLAPGTAAWAAERLFMTPPKAASPAAEQEALRGARRFHVPFGQRELTAWFW